MAVSSAFHNQLALQSSKYLRSPSVFSCAALSDTSDIQLDVDMAFQEEQENARKMMMPARTAAPFGQSSSISSRRMTYGSSNDSRTSDQSWLSLSSFPHAPPQHNSYHESLPLSNIFPTNDTDVFPSGGTVIPPTPSETNISSLFNVLPSQPQQGYLTAAVSHPMCINGNESTATSMSSPLSRSSSPPQLAYNAPLKMLPSNASPLLSTFASVPENQQSPLPIPQSATNSDSLRAYGIPLPITSADAPQFWRCAYPNCASRAIFTRGCDLRKHYNRHSKNLFCRIRGCPQSTPGIIDSSSPPSLLDASKKGNAAQSRSAMSAGRSNGVTGFSSKKDRARHEAKHNPTILCEWVSEDGERCNRRFSRADNMKDHVRRIHQKVLQQARRTSSAELLLSEHCETSQLTPHGRFETQR